jgi:crotonobetainyl-CoA:carnitine CoA-transferase CaiB-like acyl-CoA transferase
MVRGPALCDQPAADAEPRVLESVMEAVLATKPTEHWVEVLEAAGVPCGPVYNYAQMFADPQVRHRGLVQYATDAGLSEVPTSAPRSGSATASASAPSPRASESTTPRSSVSSAWARLMKALSAKGVVQSGRGKRCRSAVRQTSGARSL